MAMVEIQQFSYTYPGESEPVIHDINLSIEAGSFAVLIGKSGSGKSTLGKALAGFLFQDEKPNYSGKISIHGVDMTGLPIYQASDRVAYVQQNPEDQFCTLTSGDEIAFGLENNCLEPAEIDSRIDEVLAIVKGESIKERELSTLSGGEKQKVAIASLLALHPDVLILDEPTSNLDPFATQHIFETLHQIREKRDLTVIIIEHKLSQLLNFDPIIYEISDGTIKDREPEDVMRQPNPSSASRDNAKSENSQENAEKVLQLSGLSISLNDTQILDNISLNLSTGEFVALMGPNGSGKSTLLETIMGFHPIQSGSCTIFNQNRIRTKTSSLVNDIGYIFQNPDHQLFTQSVWDETTFTSKNLGCLTKQKIKQARNWLDKLGLSERVEDHPQRLSYGEKRRLNLVAALLHEPRLLLIDELLIGQDLENAHIWMFLLKDYAKRGNTVLLVNHHADLTQTYCDRVIYLDHGSIIVDLPTIEAFDALARLGYTASLPTSLMEADNA